MRARKAQGEILGLAVVVILIVVGFWIWMSFSINSEPDNTANIVKDKRLSSAMISTMLDTNLDCKDITLTEVIKDCANPSSTFEYCGTPRRGACEEAESVTGFILENTLNEWDRDYYFRIYTSSEEKFNHSKGECGGLRVRGSEQESFPIPTKYGTIFLELTICAR